MGKLKRSHTVSFQQTMDPSDKVVDVRDMRKHVVRDDEISPPLLGHKLLRELRSKEANVGRYPLFLSEPGDICSRLDSQHWDSERSEVLQEVAVVASNLHY